MTCRQCPNEIWICSEDEPPECEAIKMVPPGWRRVGCVELEEGEYYVKCKPGQCDARVETDTDTDPSWKLLNSTPLSLPEGWYLLCCMSGSGQPCTVKLTRHDSEQECDDGEC